MMEWLAVSPEVKALLVALKEDLGLRNFNETLRFLLEEYSRSSGWCPSVFAMRKVEHLYGLSIEGRLRA